MNSIPAAWADRIHGGTAAQIVGSRPRRPRLVRVISLPEAQDPGTESFTITIEDWHPVRLNRLIGANRYASAKLKKSDAQLLAHCCRGADVTRAVVRRRVDLELVLEPRQRAGDPDAYHKGLLDGLVHCGALRDDSRTWCEISPVTFRRGPRRRTIIRITDIGGPQA